MPSDCQRTMPAPYDPVLDPIITDCLRPLRGATTDDQYMEAYDRTYAALARKEAD